MIEALMNPVERPKTPESSAERIAELERQLAEAQSKIKVLEEDKAKLAEMAFIEPLTGLFNRRGLQSRFEEYLRTYDRNHEQDTIPTYSVIMVDLKGLKLINDTQGHDAGDDFIKKAADTFRPTDICARTGGDEFVIVLTDTNESGARIAAERLTKNLPEGLHCRMGIATSTDVAALHNEPPTLDDVITTADQLANYARVPGETRTSFAAENDIMTLSDTAPTEVPRTTPHETNPAQTEIA